MNNEKITFEVKSYLEKKVIVFESKAFLDFDNVVFDEDSQKEVGISTKILDNPDDFELIGFYYYPESVDRNIK